MPVVHRPTGKEQFLDMLVELGQGGLTDIRNRGIRFTSSERTRDERAGLFARVGIAKVNTTGAQPLVYEITEAGREWLSKRKADRAALEDALSRGLKRPPRKRKPSREEMDKRNERRRAKTGGQARKARGKVEKVAKEVKAAPMKPRTTEKPAFKPTAEARITDETKITIIETPIGQRPVYVPPKRFMVSGRFA